MRKALAILLLCSYCFSTPAIGQWLRLPVFISHYKEHKLANKDLDFFDFLSMHYASEKDHDDRDKDLPFKTLAEMTCPCNVCLPQFTSISIAQPEIILSISFPAYRPNHYALLVRAIIWQPPRLV